jgi:ATP-dependent helicase/nuclease subunit A
MAIAAADDALKPQQQAAVQHRLSSVVLSSGAGCGKTTVLTRRYLSHLIDDEAAVGQIVAITFTDRAARQMRERIRQAVLGQLDAAETDQAVQRWEKHLRDLETAQISTIHAFCAALLRQHALAAGLDPRFEVLEDFLAVNLETEALTDCLQKLLTSTAPAGEDLRELVRLYGWKPTLAAVQHLMRDRDAGTASAWLARPPKEIAADWEHHARHQLLPRYLPYLTVASPGIASCFWLLATTPCRGPKMAAKVAVVLEKLPRLADAATLPQTVEQLIKAARVAGTEKAEAWPSEEVYGTIKTALDKFRKELREKLALFLKPPKDVETAVGAGQRFLRVAAEAGRRYAQLKRRSGVLDFQDLLVKARDLLRDDAAVRDRLRDHFWFVLIDELQDTDPVQMELVDLLTGEGLVHGKLFAVGDASQSIYRFRGANVELFQQLRRQMLEEGRLDLTRNFRSQPAILNFVNALVGSHFAGAPARFKETGLEDYEPLVPHFPQVNPGPCVEFLWSPRADEDLVTDARIEEADWIARRIANMIQSEERLVVQDGKLRPAEAGDVVLLFRAMTNVQFYEAALRNHGLDYYLVGGRAFFAQQEIYDLLNLLRALENPQDAVSLAGTLRAPFCCLSDEALYHLSRHPEGLWAGLQDAETLTRLPHEQRQRAERAARNLTRWRRAKDRLPIAGLLSQVFADSAYDATTQFEFLGDRKLANLWKLIEMARSFDRSGLFGLAEFIGRLSDLVRSQPREEQAATQPENADVVRLMTVHQAKGLEFPIVVVADLAATGGAGHWPVAHWDARLGCVARPPNEDPPPFTDFGWKLWQAGEAIDQWREDLRTLYVACTRAKDYLVLSASLKSDYRPDGPWMRPLAERFALRNGRCLVPGIAAELMPAVRVSDVLSPPPVPRAAAVARKGSLPKENGSEPALCRTLVARPGKDVGDFQTSLPHRGWDAEDESDLNEWSPPHP